MNANVNLSLKKKIRIETKLNALLRFKVARLDCASKLQMEDFESETPADDITPQGSQDKVVEEVDFDCEIGFNDDDSVFAEGVATEIEHDVCITLRGIERESAFIPTDYYEIRVLKDGAHTARCIVQDDEWSSADGIPNHEELIVAHKQKMKWLKKLAKWLNENYTAELAKGPESFLAFLGNSLPSQKEVYKEEKYKSGFGRYIRCARLVWDYGSIPAWRLFKD